MTAPLPDSRPSLAELRSGLSYSGLAKADPEMHAAFAALLDIAEAAQAMFETADRNSHDADLWFEGDRMDATEQALKAVRP